MVEPIAVDMHAAKKAGVQLPKLDLAETLGVITGANVAEQELVEAIHETTDRWGADIVFECSGNPQAAASVFEPLAPAGTVVYIGIPIEYDVSAAMAKEARVEHVFRYAHVNPRVLALMESGQLDVKPSLPIRFRSSRAWKPLILQWRCPRVGQSTDRTAARIEYTGMNCPHKQCPGLILTSR